MRKQKQIVFSQYKGGYVTETRKVLSKKVKKLLEDYYSKY